MIDEFMAASNLWELIENLTRTGSSDDCIFIIILKIAAINDSPISFFVRRKHIIENLRKCNDSFSCQLFDAIKEVPVRMVSYGGSRHNISLLVGSPAKNETLKSLNKGLFGLE